jgi:hypothetical protein
MLEQIVSIWVSNDTMDGRYDRATNNRWREAPPDEFVKARLHSHVDRFPAYHLGATEFKYVLAAHGRLQLFPFVPPGRIGLIESSQGGCFCWAATRI